MTLLSLEKLDVAVPTESGLAHILTGVDLELGPGASLGIVGESGSGKSTLALALMGLLPPSAQIGAEKSLFGGKDFALGGPAPALLRGREIAMVFQDPMSALNPMFTIGTHLVDIQRRKLPHVRKAELWKRGAKMLERVGIPHAEARMHRFPHEYSGGMRQRVVIAMALLVEPKLLIADEPTTALDATVEVQIVQLLKTLRSEIKSALLVVSHSFGLIAELCDTVAVMYAGRIIETGPVGDVLLRPCHPYTRALLACEIDPAAPFDPDTDLVTIPGSVPDPTRALEGCAFAPRCPAAHERCASVPPLFADDSDHRYACWQGAAA